MRNEDFVSDIDIEWVQDNALGNAKSVDVSDAIQSLFEQCAATLRGSFDDEYSRSFVIEQLLLSVSKEAVETQPSLGIGLVFSEKLITFFMEELLQRINLDDFIAELMRNEHIVNYIEQVRQLDNEVVSIRKQKAVDYEELEKQLSKIDQAILLMEKLNLSTEALINKRVELVALRDSQKEGECMAIYDLFDKWKYNEI